MSIWDFLTRLLSGGREAAPAAASTATPSPPAIPVLTPSEAPAVAPSAQAAKPGAPPWRGTVGKESVSWRNRNPGNLRPPRTWTPAGLAGTFTGVSGTFCVFATEARGWEALARRVLQLHRSGSDTVREIIAIWAPPTENNTNAYIAGVAGKLGVRPDQPIDPRQPAVMLALAEAIRQHEGLRTDPPWSATERDAGLAAGIKAETGKP